MAYDNPSGNMFLHSKEQFVAMCVAIGKVSYILDSIDQSDFDDEKLYIEIKAVTKNCFRIVIGGLLDVSEGDIQKVLNK